MAVSATLLAASLAGGVGMAPSAWAYNPAINGTYTATVIGDWAQTNGVYHQEDHLLVQHRPGLHRPGDQRPRLEREAVDA
jgi:hypothetical protein